MADDAFDGRIDVVGHGRRHRRRRVVEAGEIPAGPAAGEELVEDESDGVEIALHG